MSARSEARVCPRIDGLLEEQGEQYLGVESEPSVIEYGLSRVRAMKQYQVMEGDQMSLKSSAMVALAYRTLAENIDPGVRTFLTCYDSNENVVEVGKAAVVRVSKLLHRRRKLQSRLAGLRDHKKRQNLRWAYIRLGERINHLVEDMHKKAAAFLCANYDRVFLPKLNFHRCQKLNRKSRACMATLGHCAFFDRTAMKAELFERTQVVEVEEEWTSKTCSCCGWVNHNLGRSKVFECKMCTSVFDRDFNACKNIMLKYFTEQSAR